ncbi:Uncharacterized protein dnm_033810 [Desulfonema magnum]|uniref:Uncharacterized protein n=1 Tax=Desulfonema magnum TaxID=45655 RepID=A0A975BKF2_9BACT|nr:Uncharacterized protein dnm_033810 [Desulfonema magnum]
MAKKTAAKPRSELLFKQAFKDTKRLREPLSLRVFVAKNSPESLFQTPSKKISR